MVVPTLLSGVADMLSDEEERGGGGDEEGGYRWEGGQSWGVT
jgi:hypothetical protein